MSAEIGKLIDVVSARISEHAEELTALDSAIGDADHGLNMKRGFDAVLADKAAIAAKPLPEALRAIGMALVMKVGGASGPLYGTLFMTLGKELPADPRLPELARAMRASVEALKQR
ncbi:MAG: DAK2 domain-containing protein, partial [Rhizobiales bacterium]|nr:DAK2 domain-containing protein [Hyphomicrobiales bacterium]